MEKKYQIFISSTYDDLKEARRKVKDAILEMYHFPVGMELFGAADEEQWEIIKETIDSSDYYVLIIAQRYGSVIQIGEEGGISYTEKEFRYAKERGIPILAFIIEDEVLVKPSDIDQDGEKIKKLKKFKEEVKNGRTVVWWNNIDDLAAKVTASLYKEFKRKKRPGWIRGDSVDIEKSLQEIVFLNNRIRELEEENKTLKGQLVERKPDLSVKINCKGIWKVRTKQIARPEFIWQNYQPLSLSDVIGVCRGKVTQEQIDEYNKGLPEREKIEEYIDDLLIYKYKTEANTEFEFYVKNSGNCKANDINITIEFPQQLLVLERDAVRTLKEPKAPTKPTNPIEEVYARKSWGVGLECLDSLNRLPSLEDYSAMTAALAPQSLL